MADPERRVYVRRFFVLLSYALSMAAWNLSGLRHTAIVPSYARYHGITNEVSAPPTFGVDSFSLTASLFLLVTFVPASYAVDRWGLLSVTVGSFGLAAMSWVWYVAGTNTALVVASAAGAAVFGPLVSASLLAISNRWFPPRERAKATAAGALINLVGAGLAIIVAPLFATQRDEVVDLALRSCDRESVAAGTVAAFNASEALSEQLLCVGEHLAAKERFCCYLPVNIPRLNLVLAIVSSAVFLFTALSVRNLPPTPPAPSGSEKEFAGLWTSLKRLFSSQRFLLLTLSDFLVSGPPFVAFSTIARLFPAVISRLSSLTGVGAIAVAIPASLISAHFLDRTKAFWSFTMFGYAAGALVWLVATVCFASRTLAGAYAFMGAIAVSLAIYIQWQTAVYETKLEYVFSPDTPIEGIVVATDRVVVNLNNLISLASFPPERVGGALNTMYIGLAIMVLGCIPTALISNRFRYLRLEYDQESKELRQPPFDSGAAQSATSGSHPNTDVDSAEHA